MQDAEERRLRRMSNTPQGEAIEGNPAKGGTDDSLMVNQGPALVFSGQIILCKINQWKMKDLWRSPLRMEEDGEEPEMFKTLSHNDVL